MPGEWSIGDADRGQDRRMPVFIRDQRAQGLHQLRQRGERGSGSQSRQGLREDGIDAEN